MGRSEPEKMQDIERLRDRLLAEVGDAADLDALERARVAVLGRKGALTERMKGLRDMEPQARKAAGARLNTLKAELAQAIEARRAELAEAGLEVQLVAEQIDVSLPVRPEREGSVHPVSQVLDEIVAIFADPNRPTATTDCCSDNWRNRIKPTTNSIISK